jgi:hypothetical protein
MIKVACEVYLILNAEQNQTRLLTENRSSTMPPIPFRENELVYKNSPDLVPGYAFDEADGIWIPTEPGVEVWKTGSSCSI